jgi:aminoglycoside phosphotransferase (APT) family kinase protein
MGKRTLAEDEERIAVELLELLERRTGLRGLRYAEAPIRIRQSHSASLYAFRLEGAPPDLAGDLVLRVMIEAGRSAREIVVQETLEGLGFPTPRVRLSGRDAAWKSPFMVMDRARGGRSDAGRAARRRLPTLLAETLAALQALEPRPVLEALARAGLRKESLGLDAILTELADGIANLPGRGFLPALDWLRRHRPEAERLVVCHGDLHASNVLAEGGRLTAVLDWHDAVIAGPAYDVGSTTALLSQVPFVGHRAAKAFLDACRERIPLAPDAVRWHEALYSLRVLATVAGCRLRREVSGTSLSWEIGARSYAAHLRRITGVEVRLPRALRLMVKLRAPLAFLQLNE